jgi:glycosyltransferase involved in cell wall biosynthesis
VEGSELPRLRALAADGDLQAHVLFLGHRDEIYDVLRAFDVFVLSSDHEGLPMVLLEAFALGLPMVGSRVGGIPEVVQEGVSGILVERGAPEALAEAVCHLLADPGLRERMGRSAREITSREFTAESCAGGLTRLYLSLCGKQ